MRTFWINTYVHHSECVCIFNQISGPGQRLHHTQLINFTRFATSKFIAKKYSHHSVANPSLPTLSSFTVTEQNAKFFLHKYVRKNCHRIGFLRVGLRCIFTSFFTLKCIIQHLFWLSLYACGCLVFGPVTSMHYTVAVALFGPCVLRGWIISRRKDITHSSLEQTHSTPSPSIPREEERGNIGKMDTISVLRWMVARSDQCSLRG